MDSFSALLSSLFSKIGAISITQIFILILFSVIEWNKSLSFHYLWTICLSKAALSHYIEIKLFLVYVWNTHFIHLFGTFPLSSIIILKTVPPIRTAHVHVKTKVISFQPGSFRLVHLTNIKNSKRSWWHGLFSPSRFSIVPIAALKWPDKTVQKYRYNSHHVGYRLHRVSRYLNEERCWCEQRYMTHIWKGWHAGRQVHES